MLSDRHPELRARKKFEVVTDRTRAGDAILVTRGANAGSWGFRGAFLYCL
jgi:hypothetical protein